MTELRLLESRAQVALRATPFKEWLLPGGEIWARFYRIDAGYLVRFPEVADFAVSGDALAVTCQPTPAVTDETCRHLFLNQVWPLVLSKRGKLVFHASVVEVAGVATAFVAESGRGKSTLAASFATEGYRFLSDDGLVVDAGDDGFQAQPHHPSIRLWKDSGEALIGAGARTAPAVQYTSKARFLAGSEINFCEKPRPLRRAYFLGDGSAAAPTFERMSESEALVGWVKNSFVLDTQEQSFMASHFDRLAVLANRLVCYRLDYPRRFEELALVRQAIVEHHRADGGVA